LFLLQLHEPVLSDKVSSPAEEKSKDGSSNSKRKSKTNCRGGEIPSHKRLIIRFHKWEKNDPGSVIGQPKSSQ